MNKDTLLLLSIIFLSFFLRFYNLSQIPPSLYWEEVALGYDAYSILETTKDHHGNFLPLISFESFGDYKPSVYFYILVPFIKLFGLNEFSARFPSAFFGSLTTLIIYLIVKQLLVKNKLKEKIALLSSLLFSIAPWQLQLSRVAFETNLALFLFSLAFYLFIYSANNVKNQKTFFTIFLSSLFFGLTIYTYHSYKILTPLFGLFLGIFYFNKLKQNKKNIIIGLSTFLLFFIPTLINFKNTQINHRFSETSAFSDINIIIKSNQKKAENNNSLATRLIYHRYR